MDGPQGWRGPATPAGAPGVGRRCEYECRTQGKTGAYPRTYPGTQRPWIDFCIEVFANLLARPGVALADPASCSRSQARALSGSAYVLLECFPTSAWRSSGLRPLPAKSKRPDLLPHWRALRAAYGLPHARVATHDDLQAVVAALSAAAAIGGPASAIARGTAAGLVMHQGLAIRVEGYIWDVSPRRSTNSARARRGFS
jgi:Protein of unknown function (DUF429)